MQRSTEYSDSFLRRLEVVGSTRISPEDSDKYWKEHKASMTWGIQKALSQSWNPRDVAILGAGKCNDIRLIEIMQRGSVENIDLYDLDADGLEIAINYVKEKINRLMPEAINFANFNPIQADVTFVMKSLLRKFDEIRGSFLSDFAPHGPRRQTMLYRLILEAIKGTLAARQIQERKYEVVVSDCILSQILAGLEIQITNLRRDLIDSSDVDYARWCDLETTVHEIFIEDHIDVLKKMTRHGGAIFIASDHTMLFRGKVSRTHEKMLYSMKERGELPDNEQIRDFGGDYIIEELEDPRFRYMNGDLLKIAEGHSNDFEIVGSREWEWNRHPHELQKSGSTFYAEKVQGVVLKKRR